MAIIQARGLLESLTPPANNGGSSTATTSTKAAATTSTPASTPTSHSSSHAPSQASSTPPSSTKESTPTSKSEAHSSSSSKTTQASSTSSAPTSTVVTSSSSSSSTSSSSTATVILSGTQSVPASFVPATTVVSGTNTFVYAAPTDDGSNASGLASAAKVSNHNSFFANKGAVAGTFTVVALVALGIFVWLFTWGQRKRRQSARRKDRYLKSGWVSDKESGHRKSGEGGEDQHDDGYDFDSSRYNRNHDEQHEEEVHEEVTGGQEGVQMSTFNSPSMVAFSNNMDTHGTYVEPAREEATSPQIHHQYSHSVTHDYLGQGTPGGDYNNNTSQYRMSGLEFPPEMAQQQQAQSNNGQYQQQYQQQQSYNIYDAGAQQQPAGRQYKSSPLANAYSGEHEHHAIGDDEDAAAHAV